MNAITRKNALIAAAAIIVLYLLFSLFFGGESSEIRYQTALVDKGDIRSFISASGTLNPTKTVEIISPIEGTVKEVLVDFNSRVKKGDPLLKLDPTPFRREVDKAKADLKKARAEASSTEVLYDSNKELFNKNLISRQEYSDSEAKYRSAMANVEQAQTSLSIARANLKATTVRSPLDGVVISRKVEAGQQVYGGEGSLLFTIGADTKKMVVEINVSEADIGRVVSGQRVSFTVDAYRNTTFEGKVSQIRNEPITNNNVVTYQVLATVDNPDGKLKPGMTADVRLLVAERKNVLRVPRAAIRFIPPQGARIAKGGFNPSQNGTVVWVLKGGGTLKPIPINPGISNDIYTEILDGSGIKENMKIVVGATQSATTKKEPLGPIRLPQPKRF